MPKHPGKYREERLERNPLENRLQIGHSTLSHDSAVSTGSVSCESPALHHASFVEGQSLAASRPSLPTGPTCQTHFAMLCVDHGTTGQECHI